MNTDDAARSTALRKLTLNAAPAALSGVAGAGTLAGDGGATGAGADGTGADKGGGARSAGVWP